MKLIVPFAALLCLLLATAASAAAGPEWSSYPRVTRPGAHGIVLADLEGNGHRRIVATAEHQDFHYSADALVVYEETPNGLQIEQLIQLAPEATVFGQVLRYRLPGSSRDLLGISAGSEFVTFGGWPLRRLYSVPLLAPQTHVTAIQDLDGDGVVELLGLTEPFTALDVGTPFVASSLDGSLVWNDSTRQAYDVAAGLVGGLAEPVIIISDFNGPAPGLVLSGPTRATLWSVPTGFHGKIRIGNYDEGAGNEFAVVSQDGTARIYRASPAFAQLRQFSTLVVDVFESFDINADGFAEILIAGLIDSRINAYDPRSGALIFNFSHPDPGVSALTVGRMATGSPTRLVHGAGLATTGRDVLRVVDMGSSSTIHLLDDELGPHSASTILRRSDGSAPVVYATIESRAAFRGSAIYLLDPDSGEMVDSILPQDAFQSRSGMKLLAVNLDADPQDELIVRADQPAGGYVGVRDGDSLALQWETPVPDFAAVTDLLVVDVDDNGSLEVVISSGGRVSFLNGHDGSLIWNSIAFSAVGDSTLAFGQLLSGGGNGVSLVKGDRMYVIDPLKRIVDRVTILAEAPMNQSVVGLGAGCEHRLVYADRIERRSCANGAVEETRPLASMAMMVRMLGGFGDPLLLSDGRRLLLQQGNEIFKQSAPIDSELAYDDQGVFELVGEVLRVYAGGRFGFHRVDFGPELFADGFEAAQ